MPHKRRHLLIKNHKTNSLETSTSKNHKTNPLETPAMKSTQTAVHSERTADLKQKTIISHEDEKVALVLSLTGYLQDGSFFDES